MDIKLPTSDKTKDFFGFLCHEMSSVKWKLGYLLKDPTKFDKEMHDRMCNQLDYFYKVADGEWDRLHKAEATMVVTFGTELARLHTMEHIEAQLKALEDVRQTRKWKNLTDEEYFQRKCWEAAKDKKTPV